MFVHTTIIIITRRWQKKRLERDNVRAYNAAAANKRKRRTGKRFTPTGGGVGERTVSRRRRAVVDDDSRTKSSRRRRRPTTSAKTLPGRWRDTALPGDGRDASFRRRGDDDRDEDARTAPDYFCFIDLIGFH